MKTLKEYLGEEKAKATCGCGSDCGHCGGNHSMSEVGETCDCCGNKIKEVTSEAVGDAAAPIYDLIDNHGAEAVLDELVRYLDVDQIEDFVSDYRRHHDMDMGESNCGCESNTISSQEMEILKKLAGL